MFEQAVALDSSFAAAHAELVRLYGYLYINLVGSPTENLQKMREAAETAYRLSPDGFHGHYAQGYFHYYGSRDYERALNHFEQALKLQPNSSDILAAIGYVMRRQGRWSEAVANQEAALSLDPRSVTNASGLGLTYFIMHDMVRCQEVFDRALLLAPDNETALLWNMLMAHFGGLPDSIAELRLAQYERHAEPTRFAAWAELADYATRRYESALSRRDRPAGDTPRDSIEFYSRRGLIYEHSGQHELSRIYYDSARVASEAQLARAPNQAEHHENLADVYSGLGRRSEAIAHAEKAIELLPMSLDAVRGANILRNVTRIFVRVGEYDRALDLIEEQLANPSRLQPVSVHRHPHWDPLREHPRFQALLEKYPVVPIQ
jgi:serine/threonine-protein kinase